MRKNNWAAREASTLVHFIGVHAKQKVEISKFKVLATTWTLNSKSFILYIYFKGAPTNHLEAQFVNNIECKQDRIIVKYLVGAMIIYL